MRIFNINGARYPSGYHFEPFRTDIQFWIDGVHSDSDFSLAAVWRSENGTELARDEVHMTIAEWTFVNDDGDATPLVESVDKQSLLDLANDVPNAAALPDFAPFRSRIEGLTSIGNAELEVVSAANPLDSYTDQLDVVGGVAQSEKPGVAYYSADSADLFTTDERSSVAQSLNINVIHNNAITFTFQNADDAVARRLGSAALYVLQTDPIVQRKKRINQPIARPIYDSGTPITIGINLGNAPQNTTIEWDLDGDGQFGNDPFEQGNGAAPRQVTYSPNPDGPNNINLPEDANHRRQVYQVRARVTMPAQQGQPPQIAVLLRDVRVALAKTKVSNNPLPASLPGGQAFNEADADNWLRDRYHFDQIANAPFVDPATLDQAAGAALRNDLDPAKFPKLSERRIVLGRNLGANAPGAITFGNPGRAMTKSCG